MALAYDGAIQRLIDAFAHLPGIGPKGAQRIAFYLLNASDEEAQTLVDAITEVKEKIRFCDICGNVCETSPCPICVDPRRDHSVICVVEEPKDVMRISRPIPRARRRHQSDGQRAAQRPQHRQTHRTTQRQRSHRSDSRAQSERGR